MMDEAEIERLIKSARPPLSKRAEADLAAILDGTYRPSTPQTEMPVSDRLNADGDGGKIVYTYPQTEVPMNGRGKKWMIRSLAIAAAVAVIAVASGILFSQPAAVASMPEMLKITSTDRSAADLLYELADLARTQPDTSGSGQIVEHIWALASVMGADGIEVEYSFMDSEKVVMDVGEKGCIRQRRYVETMIDKSGHPVSDPEAPPLGTLMADEDCSEAGQLFPEPPPDDPTKLADYLSETSGLPGIGASAADAIPEVSNGLLQERIPNPAQEAALLEFYASLPDLEVLGSAQDRLGRQVWVFAAPFRNESQERLLVDANTGHVVGEEAIYQGTSRKDLPSPAVFQYIVFEK
jgi:hypothetical protein